MTSRNMDNSQFLFGVNTFSFCVDGRQRIGLDGKQIDHQAQTHLIYSKTYCTNKHTAYFKSSILLGAFAGSPP